MLHYGEESVEVFPAEKSGQDAKGGKVGNEADLVVVEVLELVYVEMVERGDPRASAEGIECTNLVVCIHVGVLNVLGIDCYSREGAQRAGYDSSGKTDGAPFPHFRGEMPQRGIGVVAVSVEGACVLESDPEEGGRFVREEDVP